MAPEILGISRQLEKFRVVSSLDPLVKPRVEISSFVRIRVQMLENSKRSLKAMGGDGFSSKLFDHRNYNSPMERPFYIDELPPHAADSGQLPPGRRWELIREINGREMILFEILELRCDQAREKVWRRFCSWFLFSCAIFNQLGSRSDYYCT